MRLAPFVLVLALAGAGCGAASSTGVGRSHAPRPDDAIDLTLHTTDGRVLLLEDQHGSPVLLHLFATYDGASLANHRELTRFAREHQDTVVIGIAIQLEASTFATAFAEMQEPAYTITYEDGETIVRGTSDLGALEAIPAVVMIDAHGRECARHVGYASERILESMHDIALSRGGIAPVEPAPEPEPEIGSSHAPPSEPPPGSHAPAEPPPEPAPPPEDEGVIIEP